MYVCVCGSNLSCVTIGIGALSPAPPSSPLALSLRQVLMSPLSRVWLAPFKTWGRGFSVLHTHTACFARLSGHSDPSSQGTWMVGTAEKCVSRTVSLDLPKYYLFYVFCQHLSWSLSILNSSVDNKTPPSPNLCLVNWAEFSCHLYPRENHWDL